MKSSETITVDQVLDATGLLCPEPLMLVRNRIREMSEGEVLQIIATDPTTERDFTQFCHFMGHTLVASEIDDERLQFWIRRGA